MKTFTRSSLFTISSVGPSRFASTGVRVFVSVRWTFFCSSGALVSSGPGRGACIASVIAETLVHDREHLARPDPLELSRLRITKANSRARAEVSNRGGDKHLPGRGERHDPRAVDDIDAPDGIPRTLDLANVNPRSDPYAELRIHSGDRSHALDRARRSLKRREDPVTR